MNLRCSLLLALLLLIMLPQTTAQEISYDITISLSEGVAHEVVEITLVNTGDVPFEDFSYELPGDAKNILVYDDSGSLTPEFIYDEADVLMTSRFRTPVQPGAVETLSIEFDTLELVTPQNGEYIFSALFSPPKEGTKGFLLRVSLPRGMGLTNPISSGTRTDIAPLPDEILSDGTKTTFLWDPQPVKGLAVFIRYAPFLETTTTTTSAPQPLIEKMNWKGYLPIVGAILVILVVGFYILKKPKGELEQKTDFMKEDEKTIIELVRENEGIVQKRLGDHTGFSKAKVSKIVSELEKRKIIRVERIGRRNKLFLTEEFKKG